MTPRTGPAGAALGFLTVAGGAAVPSPSSVRWFPLVGALIGAILAGVWWSAAQVFSTLVAATLVVVADAAITGMLHLDGLADCADGLLPHMARTRRLEVMSAPDVGAFAVVVTTLAVALRVGAFASMQVDTTGVVGVIALWSTSRATMGVAMRTLPYARSTGLASVFARPSSTIPAALLVVASAVAVVATTQPARQVLRLTVAVAMSLLAALAVVLLARRRIGGYTGDVLGAAGVVAETIGVLALGANW